MWDLLGTLKRLQTLAEELKSLEVTGEALEGAIRITLNGHNEMVRVEIHPTLLQENPQALERGIQRAYNEAFSKLRATIMEKLGGQMPGGLPFLPGNFGGGVRSGHEDFLLPEGRLASFLRKTLEEVHPRWEG